MPIESTMSGRSSGVERNLAKVEVEGSNPFARSKFSFNLQSLSVKILESLNYKIVGGIGKELFFKK